MVLNWRKGLFHAPTLRKEIAGAVPALAALSVGELGELGVMWGDTATVRKLEAAAV